MKDLKEIINEAMMLNPTLKKYKKDIEKSVINMTSRYSDINEAFPDEMSDDELRLFVYWLQEKVILVKITATSDKNIMSPKNGQKIPKITNLQYNKSKANYGTKKKSIYG